MKKDPILPFLIFSMESYRNKLSISGKEVFNLFRRYDVFTYLKEGFDILHTQGQNYITADIQDYINHHKALVK